MLKSAQNLEFERAAQLRDRLNDMKSAPDIASTGGLVDAKQSDSKVWQPRSAGRRRRTAK